MKKVLSIFVFVLCLVVAGCLSPDVPKDINETYDVNSLKTTDVTYQLATTNTVSVLVDQSEKSMTFTTDWYLVHKDWIKTFNENQNTILSLTESKKKLVSEQFERRKVVARYIVIFGVLAIILAIIILKIICKFKK